LVEQPKSELTLQRQAAFAACKQAHEAFAG